MVQMYDAKQFKKVKKKDGTDGWKAINLGYGYDGKSGIEVVLDSLPIPVDGQVKISILKREEKPKEQDEKDMTF